MWGAVDDDGREAEQEQSDDGNDVRAKGMGNGARGEAGGVSQGWNRDDRTWAV